MLVGGNGISRTLPLAARYAHEWNAVFIPSARFRELSARLDALLQARGRPPRSFRRSLMTGCVFGRNDGDLEQKLQGRTVAELRNRGVVVGTSSAAVDQLGELAEAGVQRVMLQWLDLDDLDGLEALANAVLPIFKTR